MPARRPPNPDPIVESAILGYSKARRACARENTTETRAAAAAAKRHRYAVDLAYRMKRKQSSNAYSKTPEGRAGRARRDASPEGRKSRRMSGHRLRGIDPVLALHLLTEAGSCAICGEPGVVGGANGLVPDHDHRTNKIRGIVCGPDNRALGVLGDTAEALGRAYEYLAVSEAPESLPPICADY
jgi:hypothetical protein